MLAFMSVRFSKFQRLTCMKQSLNWIRWWHSNVKPQEHFFDQRKRKDGEKRDLCLHFLGTIKLRWWTNFFLLHLCH